MPEINAGKSTQEPILRKKQWIAIQRIETITAAHNKNLKDKEKSLTYYSQMGQKEAIKNE